jgi:hypothetical protein
VIVVNQDGGYRSYRDQVEMYTLYKAGKLQATAAKPGTSRHGLALAIDTSTAPVRKASTAHKMLTEAELAKYGLYHPYPKEPWHIEPIETKGLTFTQIKSRLAPVEIGAAFKAKYGLADNSMAFLENLYFGSEIVQKRMATVGPLKLSEVAIGELDDYPFWPALKEKLDIAA